MSAADPRAAVGRSPEPSTTTPLTREGEANSAESAEVRARDAAGWLRAALVEMSMREYGEAEQMIHAALRDLARPEGALPHPSPPGTPTTEGSALDGRAVEMRADGESWESYGRRLEKVVGKQRVNLKALHELRRNPRAKHRKRVFRLQQIIGAQRERIWEMQAKIESSPRSDGANGVGPSALSPSAVPAPANEFWPEHPTVPVYDATPVDCLLSELREFFGWSGTRVMSKEEFEHRVAIWHTERLEFYAPNPRADFREAESACKSCVGLSADATRLEAERVAEYRSHEETYDQLKETDDALLAAGVRVKELEQQISALTGALAKALFQAEFPGEPDETWGELEESYRDVWRRAALSAALPASSVVPVEAATGEAESAQTADVREQSEWLRCLDCGWVWDDLDPEHTICACFDRLGRRRSERLDTITVQLIANATDSTRPKAAPSGAPAEGQT